MAGFFALAIVMRAVEDAGPYIPAIDRTTVGGGVLDAPP